MACVTLVTMTPSRDFTFPGLERHSRVALAVCAALVLWIATDGPRVARGSAGADRRSIHEHVDPENNLARERA